MEDGVFDITDTTLDCQVHGLMQECGPGITVLFIWYDGPD
jgi:hypothetical protein